MFVDISFDMNKKGAPIECNLWQTHWCTFKIMNFQRLIYKYATRFLENIGNQS